nr:hypothetical protein [Tanacetum cinerariifolium]
KLEKYNPKIVRIGFNSQLEDAKMVSLEAKAKTYIGKTNQEVLIQQLNPGTNPYLEVIFLEEAIVIFTIVSWCKERILQSINDNTFDLVIIDEVGQVHEAGVLPALGVEATRFVLVGDPKQLQTTISSQTASLSTLNVACLNDFSWADTRLICFKPNTGCTPL